MGGLLKRELSLKAATALVIANMIGTGIFATTGFLARDLGRPVFVIGIWAVGAVVAMAGSLAYAELGINLPRSGGEYAYLREGWGPGIAFLSGWASFFAGFSAPIAAAALAFSEYLAQLLPVLRPVKDIGPHRLHLGVESWISVGVIALFAAINVFGVRGAARLQVLLTGVKVLVLAVFLALALAIGHGSWQNLARVGARESSHSIAAQMAVSLIFVMFAYSGWNAANYVVEEMKAPDRDLPRAAMLGASIVAVLYLGLNVAYLYALPISALKNVIAVGAVSATALFGAGAGHLFSAIMAISLLSTIGAMSLVGPRVYYAMAQDGCFPRFGAAVDSRRGTPVLAIVSQATASALMVVTGTFEALIYYIGFTLLLFAGLTVAGLLRLRRRGNWRRLSAVSVFYPAVPLLFLAATLWMIAWSALVHPKIVLLSFLTLVLGLVFYHWRAGLLLAQRTLDE